MHGLCLGMEDELAESLQEGKKEDPENYGLVDLISVAGKVIKKIIRKRTSQDLKDKIVIRSGQHEFMKGTPCLTNLVAISHNVTSLLVKRREMGFGDLDFRKDFD
ncbi:hypothetical protein TURU_005644 [Turdus rufiventris]|nr:hypothetical protein TURU_005644 [Turdus rufiventris]